MNRFYSRVQRLRHVTWTLPIVVAVATLAGMLTALVADGPGDTLALSVLAMPTVLAVIGTAAGIRQPRNSRSDDSTRTGRR